jgi:large subunit ribosomal protein L18
MGSHAKDIKRSRRARRGRKHICALQEKAIRYGKRLLRFTVYKSAKHISGQIDEWDPLLKTQKVILALSTQDKAIREGTKVTGNCVAAGLVGAKLAERLLVLQKDQAFDVAFDRAGYPYHGRVKALVEAARATGLRI